MHMHRHIHTPSPTYLQTHTHTHTYAHTDTNTATDTATQRRRDAETQRHGDTATYSDNVCRVFTRLLQFVVLEQGLDSQNKVFDTSYFESLFYVSKNPCLTPGAGLIFASENLLENCICF